MHGFSEISDILKTHISGEDIPVITKITTITWGTGMVSKQKSVGWRHFIELEISFSNAQSVRGQFRELKSQIEKAYLSSALFAWSNIIFGVGVVITAIGIFL